MKAIFNSLGSNYSRDFVSQAGGLLLQSLKGFSNSVDVNLLSHFQTDNQVVFTYKGRHALTLALTQAGLRPETKVGIQAFTCWAVEEAVLTAGMKPIFIDVAEASLNPDLMSIKRAYKSDPFEVLILQHTLGFAADIEEIRQWTKQNNVFLIEDLAHAYGAKTKSGKQLGTFGDAVALSFGRDKIIDAVSGGALLSKSQTDIVITTHLSRSSLYKDLLYPLITTLIRDWYPLGVGKLIHVISKSLGLLSSPIANSYPKPTSLPQPLQQLAAASLADLDTQIKHRQKIAHIYQSKLKNELLFADLDINNSSCLRFPIKVTDRDQLITSLKQSLFFLSDTWFKQPVEKGRLSVKSTYQQGSCPQAEILSAHIFNLPTHVQVTEKKANQLVDLINNLA